MINNSKIWSFVLSSILVGQMAVANVLAIPIELDSSCCVNNYPVYLSEYETELKLTEGANKCYVDVEIEPLETKEDVSEYRANEREKDWRTRKIRNFVSGVGEAVWSALGTVKNGIVGYSPLIWEWHTKKYHSFLDEKIFGQAISKVSEYENSKELQEYLKKFNGKCTSENPKPECVIEKAMCSYELYAKVLFEQAGQPLEGQSYSTENWDQLILTFQKRDQALVEELDHTKQALDTAIMVYSQFFQTYRLHLRFKEIVSGLVSVRNLTGNLRELVESLPNKFLGVATTDCN